MLKEILGIIKKVLICIIIALVITMNDYGSICRIVYDLSKGKITGVPYSIAVDDEEDEDEDEDTQDDDDISESLKDYTKGLEYEYNEENKTATVSGYNRNATYSPVEGVTLYANNSTVEIPEKVSKNGLNYTVTGIKPGVFNDVEGELPKIVVRYNEATKKYTCEQKQVVVDEIVKDNNGVENIVKAIESVKEPYANVENIVLPESITTLDDNVFKDCENLNTIDGLYKITSIGESAFENCKNLYDISSLSSITSVKTAAFKNCERLEIIVMSNKKKITIADDTFDGCSDLTIWGYNVSEIKNYINGKDNLKFIALDDFEFETIEFEVDDDENINLSADGKLKEKTQETTGSTSKGLRLVGYTGDYSEIELLGELDGKSLVSIGEDVFKDKTELENIVLPYTIYILEDSCFSGCTGISNINIPSTVISICDEAFSGCTGIEKIENISGIKYLGNKVFDGCSNLEEIWIKSKSVNVGTNIFNGTKSGIKIYCYSSSQLFKNYSGCIAIDTLSSISIYQYPDKLNYRADKIEELDLKRIKD